MAKKLLAEPLRHFLVLPDIHSKNADFKAVDCALNYAADHEWTDCVQIGDLVEGDSVSAHNKGKFLLLEGQRLLDDYKVANGLLSEIVSATRLKKVTVLKGNHEYRIDRYIEEHPEMKGLIEVENGLSPIADVIDCYPGGKLYNIGKLHFTHGIYAGGNASKKHLDVFGVNIVFGHTHEVGIQTKVSYGKGKAIAAYNIGCLCRLDMPYLEGRPTNWQHAFGEGWVAADGQFNMVIHNINKGSLLADGKRYSWRI